MQKQDLNWIDSYYEALEFFYFEPQHMRRRRVKPAPPADDVQAKEQQAAGQLAEKYSNFDVVKKHLRKMEVTLNHNITQFFCLAPDTLRNKLFERVFPGEPLEGSFTLHGREVETYFGPTNVMQPDFLFVSETSIVSIEMKVKSKSSINQVMKYVLLGMVVEKQSQPKQNKKHYLILLGSGTFADQFKRKEHAQTADDLKRAISEDLTKEFLFRKKRWQDDRERFCEIVQDVKIGFWSYQDFSKFLQEIRPPDLDDSLGAEVCRKLMDGLREEFSVRELL